MICYRDRSYCLDQYHCQQRDGACPFVLSDSEALRADALQLPIAWMSFKSTCPDYKEKTQL